MAESKDLIISDFSKGIGQSYNFDFYNFRNLDIFSVPGSVKINKYTAQYSVPANADFVADTGDNLNLSVSRNWATGTPITLTTTGTLPAPLAVSTTYYVIRIDAITYKLSDTYAHAIAGTDIIDITNTGSGTHTIVAPVMKQITKIVLADKYYALDSENKVWYYDTSYLNWQILGGKGNGSGAGYGLEYWKDYLFVMRSTSIDVWGPISGTPAWTLDWDADITTATTHPTFISHNDDKLYIGCGRYVASIEENAGQNFTPGDGGTSYTFTTQALDLPEDYSITTISELGNNLMLGTSHAYKQVATIFPWDRVSSSFNIYTEFQENGVKQMINIDNILYVTAGANGNIYRSDGTNTIFFTNIPKSLTGIDTNLNSVILNNNAIMNYKGRLHIGIGAIGSTLNHLGVYSITKDGKITLEHTISTGNAGGTTNRMEVTALIPTSGGYMIGWRSDSSGALYGIDIADSTYCYPSYAAYFETGLMQVGLSKQKRKFTDIEIILAKELATGQGIRVSYRENLTDTYTVLGTYDYSTYGAVSHLFALPQDLLFTTVQFKVEFTTGASSATSPELKSIRLI